MQDAISDNVKPQKAGVHARQQTKWSQEIALNAETFNVGGHNAANTFRSVS